MHLFDWQKKVSLRPGLLLLGLLLGTVVLPLAAAQEAGASAEVETATPEHAKINTADATPVDPGQVEVEWSYELGRAKRSWSGGGHSQVRPLLREQTLGLAVTAGVVDNLDVSVGGGYLWLKDKDVDDSMAITANDWADFELGARYRFLTDPDLGLDLAYSAGVTIPKDTDTRTGANGPPTRPWAIRCRWATGGRTPAVCSTRMRPSATNCAPGCSRRSS
jgi:hypothetical protein